MPPAPGTAATPESVASVVSPDDLTGFPPLGAAASVSPTGGAPATKSTGGRASASAGRARKSRGGRASAAKGAKVRAARPGNLGTADSDESTVVLSPESPPAAQPPSNAAKATAGSGISDGLERFGPLAQLQGDVEIAGATALVVAWFFLLRPRGISAESMTRASSKGAASDAVEARRLKQRRSK